MWILRQDINKYRTDSIVLRIFIITIQKQVNSYHTKTYIP